ncbi:zinc metalloprotease [Neisseria arctica]|uniref:Zinc metalloprotease n=1 Tax=Neisseria arctica TaxID=1470200 RepID=A0A0J0YRY8_9NEIS|nr:RIP metalloprotease RseP [Neisseria arctica]KLT72881.1 zinc metalloprotease [Neisseria arctica]UOO86593.1 RIP metalloprotease RseP [Neisseria arctica]
MTILAFIVAILILVSLHEFGHYAVARLFGVKVLRFSVGFGKPFYKKKRGDTEWCLAPIPLGGYVKMVDTREGPVPEADLPYAFDKQHPAKRIAIVAAGPLTNLLLAVLFYGLSFSFGVTEIRPYVGMVEPASIAAKAGFQPGDKILSVNGTKVKDWTDAQAEIVLNLEAGQVAVDVQTENATNATRTIDVAGTQAAKNVAKQEGNIGFVPFKLTNKIGLVAPNSPAERAGLKKGDVLLAADGRELSDWRDWVVLFRNSPGKNLEITYGRDGAVAKTQLRPDSEMSANGMLSGKVGVAAERDKAWDEKIRHQYMPSIGEAFAMGTEKMWNYSVMTVKFFGKLLTGQASTSHISGPLTIADVAGRTAAMGLQSYLEFLALVSVSLGVLNLLPIPVLDGGHLVYYTAEWIRGKPLSERIQMLGLRLGMAAMLMLMLVAFFNDITRLLG